MAAKTNENESRKYTGRIISVSAKYHIIGQLPTRNKNEIKKKNSHRGDCPDFKIQ